VTRDESFKAIFYSESIAVVGASSNPQKPGGMYVLNLICGGFQGKLYPVNTKGGEILGLKSYPNLKSIPEPVDYVICCVPKSLALDVLDDCVANGAKVVQFFTAGFRETGEEEGIKLEEKMRERVQGKNLRIIGPNCAGVTCPAHFRAYGPAPFTLNPEAGGVAFVSHSSGLVGNVIEAGLARGIKFSKPAAFNNCCDLSELDFLDYVGDDPETKIVGSYLEGTSNGTRLFQLMKEIARIKPLVVWKGGQTEAGAQAAASHTASLAGSINIWKVAIKQAGAIFVPDFGELVDSLLAFQYFSPFTGDNVAIIGGFSTPGGGASVTSADECASQGLKVPPFTKETQEKLKAMLGTTGTILRNPLDMGAGLGKDSLKILKETLEVIAANPGIDAIMFNIWVTWFHKVFSPLEMKELFSCLKDFRENHEKPLMVISRSGISEKERSEDIKKLAQMGMPTYSTIARAAKALANVREYFKNHNLNEVIT
jgi:acyl-CoA synthetase (NDP forming)